MKKRKECDAEPGDLLAVDNGFGFVFTIWRLGSLPGTQLVENRIGVVNSNDFIALCIAKRNSKGLAPGVTCFLYNGIVGETFDHRFKVIMKGRR